MFEFFVILSNGILLICIIEVVEEIFKVRVLIFFYIVVIGIVGRLLVIKVNGLIVCYKIGWGGIIILLVLSDGILVFGENEFDYR